MNDQLPTINNQNQDLSQAETGNPVAEGQQPTQISKYKDKALSILKSSFDRLKTTSFYKNKFIFWPITIMGGLVVLTLIIGLIFGQKSIPAITPKNSPTPLPQTQTSIQDNGTVSPNEQSLKNLKDEIDSFDVKQNRLQSPTLNFDVKF